MYQVIWTEENTSTITTIFRTVYLLIVLVVATYFQTILPVYLLIKITVEILHWGWWSTTQKEPNKGALKYL